MRAATIRTASRRASCHSAVAVAAAVAAVVAPGAAAPAPDTVAPSAPGALTTTSISQSTVTLSWNASTDNVGVTGYGLYLESIGVGSTTQTSSVFSGLSCGTSYTLGVDAFDAAGNRSTISSLIVSTNACPDTSPPTAPTNLQQTAATASSVAAGWNGIDR